MSTAVVVGSGPNGLAAAVSLAREGVELTVLEAAETVGGGIRAGELTPGLLPDHCSATHPMAIGSPFLRALDPDHYGLCRRLPDIDRVHPLDSGDAGVLRRSVLDTADGLGGLHGRTRQRVFGPPADGCSALVEDLMRPFLHRPGHPMRLATAPAAALPPSSAPPRRRPERARTECAVSTPPRQPCAISGGRKAETHPTRWAGVVTDVWENP